MALKMKSFQAWKSHASKLDTEYQSLEWNQTVMRFFFYFWSLVIYVFSFGQRASNISVEKSLKKVESQQSTVIIPANASTAQTQLSPVVVSDSNSSFFLSLSMSISKLFSFQSQPYDPNRKQLVLDLDETLISSSHKHSTKHDISVRVYIGGVPATFFVRKRPGVDAFLEAASQWFELVVFTASLAPYANAVIDQLDPQRRITRRYYRQSCTNKSGAYVKDLQIVCKDLSKVVIIDNSPAAYSCNKENAIPIEDYFGNNQQDQSLTNLLPLLEDLKNFDDLREGLRTHEVLTKNSKEIEQSIKKAAVKASTSNY